MLPPKVKLEMSGDDALEIVSALKFYREIVRTHNSAETDPRGVAELAEQVHNIIGRCGLKADARLASYIETVVKANMK